MGKFHDWLDAHSDADLPEDLLTSAMTAYDEDMSIPVAKVTQVEEELNSATKTVAELKALNFDLIRSGAGGDGKNSDSGKPDNEHKVVTIASLFE